MEQKRAAIRAWVRNLSPFKGIAGDEFQTVCGSFFPYIHIPPALRNMLYLYKKVYIMTDD